VVSDTGYGDFEFERRFFVRTPPMELLSEPDPVLIVQSYFLAQDGYALRLRVQASGLRLPLGPDADPLDVLDEVGDRFEFCAVTLKGPMNVGTRYEAEREIDVVVGTEMIRRGGHRIVKNRYSVWLGADGWVVDVFGGPNAPLVVAECERAGPVTDLQIPAFCESEVTDDARFANDGLARVPYREWAGDYEAELRERGPRFLTDFGRNDLQRRG